MARGESRTWNHYLALTIIPFLHPLRLIAGLKKSQCKNIHIQDTKHEKLHLGDVWVCALKRSFEWITKWTRCMDAVHVAFQSASYIYPPVYWVTFYVSREMNPDSVFESFWSRSDPKKSLVHSLISVNLGTLTWMWVCKRQEGSRDRHRLLLLLFYYTWSFGWMTNRLANTQIWRPDTDPPDESWLCSRCVHLSRNSTPFPWLSDVYGSFEVFGPLGPLRSLIFYIHAFLETKGEWTTCLPPLKPTEKAWIVFLKVSQPGRARGFGYYSLSAPCTIQLHTVRTFT